MYAVIMAGGKGTRFWPRSRERTPKQLLDILGQNTMIQETLKRLTSLVSEDHIIVVTGREHADALKQQVPEIPEGNILIEPFGRNTAPCICLAAMKIQKKEPEAVMAVLPADHYIGNAQTFCTCLEAAKKAAQTHNALVTMGISPSRPETGYGYIQYKEEIDQYHGIKIFKVARFHEKPRLQKAEEFLRQGNFLWNSGIFVWKASTILNEIHRYLPGVYQNIMAVEPFFDTHKVDRAITDAYKKIDTISIDYGVMEKAENVLTLKGDFIWNDIGSWSAVYEMSKKDKGGNALKGNVITIDSENTLVHSPEKLCAVVGVKDLIIVNTEDALLVCAKDRAQDVKKVVDMLHQKGEKEYL